MTQAAQLAQYGTNTVGLAFKNRIINGAMSFWQRGTSFTNPAVAGNFYTADRWGVNRASDVTGATVSQSTDVPSGFQYSLKLQRTAGNTSTASLFLFNSNETVNTLGLAGQSVTISFWVKTGANYSGGAISVIANSGTGTDQRVYAYTGSTSFINTTQAITSTWTRYSFTGAVSSSATEVGFYISWTPAGTAGADDSIYITGVQLEVGSTATSFDYRPYGTELALCQRYFFKTFAQGTAPAQNAGFVGAIPCWIGGGSFNAVVDLPVVMRATPTIVAFNPSAANSNFSSGDASVVSAASISDRQAYVYSSTTTGSFAYVHATASIEL